MRERGRRRALVSKGAAGCGLALLLAVVPGARAAAPPIPPAPAQPTGSLWKGTVTVTVTEDITSTQPEWTLSRGTSMSP
jgi:hypothetical protein